jgi:signal transduction histidine kinase
MSDEAPLNNAEFRAAFQANEQQVRINTGKVACTLVIVLMPVGVVLDSIVYKAELHKPWWGLVGVFFGFRLICSLLATGLFYLHKTRFGMRHFQYLGLPIALLPAAFIALMIYNKDGPNSPYYAGLNLILLAVSVVVHWSTWESLLAVAGVFLMYIVACVSNTSREDLPIFFNNLYFLTLTGVIVITGNYFFNRLRFREFALRFELDKNRRALAESNQKLLELDQIKGRFFANISHELRTPLTLLLSPLETMMHGRDRQIDADSRNLMAIMHGNGMRLLKLINDLLDLVRLESGRMEVKREALEMGAYVKGLIGAAQQMADAKGLRLETWVEPGLGAVLADRDKLEKMILNLVFNALKFTPNGGLVALRVEKTSEHLAISVRDTGVGISEKNLPFVFDRFWQADNSSKRKYQGVGIGLSLVKELTEIQGGKVSVVSEEGKGTTFTIQLPFLQPKPEDAPKPEATPAAGEADRAKTGAPAGAQSEEWLGDLYRRAALFPAATPVAETSAPVPSSQNGGLPSVLVADDEPDMLRFLKSQLNAHYQVIEAVDGLQALEKARQFLPDIILLDMNMPGKDGLQVCRELRGQAPTRDIPVIILTARADEETKLVSLSAGANDFLSKPFSTTELHVRLKNLVVSHQYQNKLSEKNQTLESTIEQLKETETLLVQTEKMVSLGRMSAGIIHEINNPLNYATTGLFTLRNKGKLLAPEQRAEYEDILKDVEEGIGRVKSIVTDLKTFTHPDTEQVDYVDAAEIITSALRFLSSEWKDKIEIRQTLAPGLEIRGNKNKLLQVFVNLLQNSLDALKRKSFTDEKPLISIDSAVTGGKAVVTIRDNGEGIEAAALGKIFDPFFTTKDVGEGMGLGLTICYRIVKEYNGHISARSERGKFCEFRLEFPAKE